MHRYWLVALLVVVNVAVAVFVYPMSCQASSTQSGSGSSATKHAAKSSQPATPPDLVDPQIVDATNPPLAVGSAESSASMPLFEQQSNGNWRYLRSALTSTPSWESGSLAWPSVLDDNGEWWMFFSATDTKTGLPCIGLASTTNPADGFKPESQPLLCQASQALLDPTPYLSGGNLVVTWTAESSSTSGSTNGSSSTTWQIVAAPFDLTTQTFGTQQVLLTAPNDSQGGGSTQLSWERGIVAGSGLADVDGQLLLFYSGNEWGTSQYGSGYATCQSPLGPCQDQTTQGPLDISTPANISAAGIGSLRPAVSSSGSTTTVGFFGVTEDQATGQGEPATFTGQVGWNGSLQVTGVQQVTLTG
jgi:hypothetical protein